MKRVITFISASVLLFGFMMVCSFTSKSIKARVITTNNKYSKFHSSTSMVIPNPKSGVLNLYCSNDLQSPLSIRLISSTGNIIQCKTTLNAEGIPNYKFIQLITSAYPAGEYRIVLKDVKGKESTRQIFINK